jgi:hypothetical protein
MNYDPYYLAMTQMGNPRPQMQDIGGLSPVFQNIAAQQANQNAVMQQGQGMTQAAGQTSQGGGMNPMAMAAMLRKKDPTKPAPVTDYSQPMPNYLDPAYQQAGY